MEKTDLSKSKITHILFEIGIFLKGLNGFLQIIGGFLLIFLKPSTFNKIVVLLTQNELSEDSQDLVANFLLKTAHQLSVNSQIFGVIFLLTHGLVKIFLVVSLRQRKLWAYPMAIVFFLAFIFYQLYRFTLSHSPWMIILTVLDIFVVVLTWLEYRRIKGEFIRSS